MTKISIINFGTRMNKGSTALLNTKIKTLRSVIDDAKFTVFALHNVNYNQFPVIMLQGEKISFNPIITFGMLSHLSMCMIWNTIYMYCKKDCHFLIDEKLKHLSDSDIVINTGGDGLTEDYGTPLTYFLNIWMAILLNRPVVIYAESIGPFKNYFNKIMANFILNRVKLITLRESISKKNLIDIGIIKPPIYITADSAFLLEPDIKNIENILIKENIHKSHSPIIGFSVSKIISNYGFLNYKDKKRRYDEYIKLMTKTIECMIEYLNATIVFIPHVIAPWSDDRVVAEDILNISKYKQNIISIRNEYTPEELKGIIGQCDMFIGARMHTCIASTSMLVPTIAIAYSHKTKGIIGDMLGCEKYVIDIRDLTYDKLIIKIEEVWKEREKIRSELKIKIPLVKKQAMKNAKLVKDLLCYEKDK